jgi:hypothetical protein
VALALASACGSLVEVLPAGANPDGGGGDAGMVCSFNNACDCAPCTDVAQCLPGLGCNPAKHQGTACGFSVCSSGGG